MGAKIAGIHFLTVEPDKLLPKLKRKFNKQPGPSEKDLGMLALLRAMAQPEIDGGLIGGASLSAEKFSQVVNY